MRRKCYNEWVQVRRCAIKNVGDTFAIKINMSRQVEDDLDEERIIANYKVYYENKKFIHRWEKVQGPPSEEEAAEEEEEPEAEEEAAEEIIGGVTCRGYDVNFSCLDLITTCQIRYLRAGDEAVLIMSQAADIDPPEYQMEMERLRRSISIQS